MNFCRSGGPEGAEKDSTSTRTELIAARAYLASK